MAAGAEAGPGAGGGGVRFTARARGSLHGPGDAVWRCALGRGGLVAADDKREGDGATPTGSWPMRRLFFRPDAYPSGPETALEAVPLRESDGWCDAGNDPLYNRFVSLPYPARHERMWRGDRHYHLVVELGWNDDPPAPFLGSAIFMHIASGDYGPTEGCVALAEEDLLEVLALAGPGSVVEIAV